MLLGDTLIRAVLHLDPTALDDDEWVTQITLAEWAQYELVRKFGLLMGGMSGAG